MGSNTSSITISHLECHSHVITIQHTLNCIITVSNLQSK